MKNKNALIRCMLGVVVASAMLVVTWSTTSARFSPTTTTTTVGSSSKVAPPVLSSFTRIPFRNILTPATVTTDQSDYHPGDHVTVTGSGFQAGETVSLTFIEDPNHDGPHMLSTTADSSGNISDNNFIVDPEDIDTTFTLNAVGLSSGQTAMTTFTDSCSSGHGVVTVVGNGGSCVSGTAPHGGGPYNWEVAQGGSYTMTIAGVTECTGDAITVFVQSTPTGNFCFTANKTSAGTYTGSFAMPNQSCFTYPISYKCGADQPCNNSNTFNARGPNGACTVHLRASTFDGDCHKTGDDTDCTGGGGPQGCVLQVPGDQTLGCNPAPESIPVCDTNSVTVVGCITGNVSCSYSDTVDGCVHTRTITYTATGCDGVACPAIQHITWTEDHTKPVLSGCPTDNPTVQCYADVPAAPTVTATDNCDGTVQVHFDETQSHQGSSCNNVITRTWTAIDSCGGNTASCTQTITVNDTTAPTLQGTPNATASYQCVGDVPGPPNVTATDNCDSNVTVHYSQSPQNPNSSCNATITRTWTATDTCGNPVMFTQTITVNDTTPPTIGPAGQNGTIECPATPVFTAPTTASDNCDPSPSIQLVGDQITPGCGGTYTETKTWKAKDACGNWSSPVSQTITVVDTTPPTITATGGDKTVYGCTTTWSFNVPTASDTCGSAQVVQVGDDVRVNGSCSTYSLTRTWRAVDACGNPSGTVSQTVTVECNNCAGLTIGFWQNNNGQGIIKAFGTNLATFLRGYAPFLDLPSGANANTTATYVYNVIKAANASGAAMNAMLKAQMLATALNVYFSDDSKGGNKIGASTPLGNVKIDLTKICKMINGNCNGAYENVSAAFNGATCMTVSDMLTYAASQSNSGGTNWYGQVKATQELAKDAFDAINNKVAFVCL